MAGRIPDAVPLVIAGHGTRVDPGAAEAHRLVDRVRRLLPGVDVGVGLRTCCGLRLRFCCSHRSSSGNSTRDWRMPASPC